MQCIVHLGGGGHYDGGDDVVDGMNIEMDASTINLHNDRNP